MVFSIRTLSLLATIAIAHASPLQLNSDLNQKTADLTTKRDYGGETSQDMFSPGPFCANKEPTLLKIESALTRASASVLTDATIHTDCDAVVTTICSAVMSQIAKYSSDGQARIGSGDNFSEGISATSGNCAGAWLTMTTHVGSGYNYDSCVSDFQGITAGCMLKASAGQQFGVQNVLHDKKKIGTDSEWIFGNQFDKPGYMVGPKGLFQGIHAIDVADLS